MKPERIEKLKGIDLPESVVEELYSAELDLMYGIGREG